MSTTATGKAIASAPDERTQRFRRLEYDTLRREILALKERVMKVETLGLTSIPIVIAAGQKYNVDMVLMASPLVTVVFALMLMFEQSSIMRAGRYIRTRIEPALSNDSEVLGWEHWLEAEKQNRDAETLFAWSAYVAFCIYYVLGSFLAAMRAQILWGVAAMGIAIGLYAGGFLFGLVFVHQNLKTKTT